MSTLRQSRHSHRMYVYTQVKMRVMAMVRVKVRVRIRIRVRLYDVYSRGQKNPQVLKSLGTLQRSALL